MSNLKKTSYSTYITVTLFNCIQGVILLLNNPKYLYNGIFGTAWFIGAWTVIVAPILIYKVYIKKQHTLLINDRTLKTMLTYMPVYLVITLIYVAIVLSGIALLSWDNDIGFAFDLFVGLSAPIAVLNVAIVLPLTMLSVLFHGAYIKKNLKKK